jgi:cation diffusion facilitator family transporter
MWNKGAFLSNLGGAAQITQKSHSIFFCLNRGTKGGRIIEFEYSGLELYERPLNYMDNANANREKNWAASSSVLAAVFLLSIKLVIGILTGSLGILAEAAHSGLDLVAAAVTFVAVKISGRPADRSHTYGHGKVENLSALFEALLLLVTCVWIIYEAIDRLFFKQVKVEATIWSFLIMFVSIIIDFSRSRMLSRVAKTYGSQALEADALHFSTDILSSSVVIAGLGLIVAARQFNLAWLSKADSVAAMGVAGIVIYVSLQLSRRAVAELLDEVPDPLQDEISRAVSLPGVVEVRQVRVRRSGPQYFADLALAVSRSTNSEQSHQIADQAEKAVQALLPGASVLVHVEPVPTEDEQLAETLRLSADRYGFGVHHIHISDVRGQQILSLHLDVDEDMPLEEAHSRASAFEKSISEAYPDFDQVWTHLEPVQRQADGLTDAVIYRDEGLERIILDLPRAVGIPCEIHDVTLFNEAGCLSISFHCLLNGETSILKAHELSEQMEAALRGQISNLDRVLIHMEPMES